ncbi:transcriptional regulator NanR [compost metagenome]
MELDEQFHNLIVDVADNPYLASYSTSLQIHIRRFKYVFLAQPIAATSASVEEHAEMIQALEAGKPEIASSIMKQNLLRPMHELYALINELTEGNEES